MLTRSVLLALSLGMVPAVPLSSSRLPEQLLPIYGGSGGTAFSRSCGAGKVLSGLRSRGAVFVDAVGLLCRPVLADGTLGPESVVGTLAGGGGGTSGVVSCGGGTVMSRVAIRHGTYVQRIDVDCKTWDAAGRKMTGAHLSAGHTKGIYQQTVGIEGCEAATQPMRGFRGRAAGLVDAIGFNCNEP